MDTCVSVCAGVNLHLCVWYLCLNKRNVWSIVRILFVSSLLVCCFYLFILDTRVCVCMHICETQTVANICPKIGCMNEIRICLLIMKRVHRHTFPAARAVSTETWCPVGGVKYLCEWLLFSCVCMWNWMALCLPVCSHVHACTVCVYREHCISALVSVSFASDGFLLTCPEHQLCVCFTGTEKGLSKCVICIITFAICSVTCETL